VAQEKTKRNWLSTTAAPALPTPAELAGSFKHKEQDVFWFIKHLLAELSVEESQAGETVREHLAPVLNGFAGHWHQAKIAACVLERATEKEIGIVMELGELGIGNKINRARSALSPLLSLSKRREQARLEYAQSKVNDSGDE